MTRFAICGPVRHAFYVTERLLRQGVARGDIQLALTRSDLGNNARTEIGFDASPDAGDQPQAVTWTADSRALLHDNVPGGDALTGTSPTPVHAIFNMFYQNSLVAQQIPEGPEVIARLRSDMVLYDDCVARLQSGASGLAWNPIAGYSDYISDQFMAFPRDAYAQIWATDGFAETFTQADGVPESMIRDRVKRVLGKQDASFRFERFIDFDIVYENARWTDTPRMYWIKKYFGWRACYAACGRKGAVTRTFDRLHLRTVGQSSVLRKTANLLLKIAYLPVFAVQMPGIARDLRTLPTPPNAKQDAPK